MAAALVVTMDPPETGSELSVAGTGFHASDNITLVITAPDGTAAVDTVVAADNTGAFSWGSVDIENPGIAHVKATDESGNEVEETVEVFQVS